MKNVFSLTIILLCLCCISAGCITDTNDTSTSFIQDPGWAADVKTALNDFVLLYGNSSETYDPYSYVVSDFDNTACIYDIELQARYYQVETMSFAQDPDTLSMHMKNGLHESYYNLTDDIVNAYRTLYITYGPFSPSGLSKEMQITLKKDPIWQEFASKLLCLVSDSSITDDTWKFFLLAGMTADEIYNLTYSSCNKYSQVNTYMSTISGSAYIPSEVGQKSFSFVNGLRVANATKEVWNVLEENGIDVWVCSASELNQVRAAVDFFGLHPFCTGIAAKTLKFDHEGKLIPEYDYETGLGALAEENGTWTKSAFYLNGSCAKEGKVNAILNGIAPYYDNKTPIACFMDSTGDFNFCTEFSTIKLVICFNRADRNLTDGGGLIAVVAVYQQESPESDLQSVNSAGDTLYLLQGRNENGLRDLRPSTYTIVFGETEEKLFKDENNYKLLNYISNQSMSIGDILNTFALKTAADDTNNPIGTEYGFLTTYRGYHSI